MAARSRRCHAGQPVSVPNLITLARLLAAPVAIGLILNNHLEAAFWVFVAAGVSDAVDGFLAKRFGAESELGRFLDPLADKALLVSVYVALGQAGHLPTWLVILVVFRDVLIIGGAILLHTLGISLDMTPVLISKINTAAQIVLAACVLGVLGFALDGPWRVFVDVMVYLVAVTTFASGAVYLMRWAGRVATVGDSE